MAEFWGVLAAVASSALGGASVSATRFLAAVIDPLAIGSFRFGFGILFLLPIALYKQQRWPARADLQGVVGLGVLFFFVFPLLFNASLIFTTAARGALALSTLPLLTMVVGAALRIEPLTARKSAGVVVASIGLTLALLSGLSQAPPAAWRGDLLMIAAALCMALYSVWSRSFIRRSGPLTFTALAMAAGAPCLIVCAYLKSSFEPVSSFTGAHWLAVLFLGSFGSALTFFLWALALEHTTPTKVAVSVTVNPVAAALVGAILLGEPIRWSLVLGIVVVFAGIVIATTNGAIFRRAVTEE